MADHSKLASAVVAALLVCAPLPAAAQTAAPAYTPPRLANGQPDLQGIWQVLNTAAENLEGHVARKGIPAGISVVEGNRIPYRPEALAQRQENAATSATADPINRCVMPGVPRITYLPFPFQIFQFSDMVVIVYEFLNLTRFVFMDDTPAPSPDVIDFYMGYSRGRWEGNTLVVEVTNHNDQTWFDKAGNHHSAALRVVERYTRVSPDVMTYEATMEDPEVFTAPWKMSMPLYRRQERDVRLLEYECYAFREEELAKAEEEALKKN